MSEEINYEDAKYQRFNDSLDEEGVVEIATIPFQRSRILFEMAVETYKDAFAEHAEQEFEELKQSAFDYYPSCIAYNFRLSEKGEGSSDPVRKLLHLKDTSESIVFVLYALVMGEVRNKLVNLKAAQIFVAHDTGGNPVYTNFNTDKLLSDALKQKIQNMKAIIGFAQTNALGFKSEEIGLGLLDDLLVLQSIRNDISHHAAPTREQAEEELSQVIPLFREMLTKTKFLENCKILRFESYTASCRCETFNGHSLNREYDNHTLSAPQCAYVLGLGQDQLFALWDSECFSLSPFLHFDKDATGHESYLCFFKGKKEGKFWYEPVKIRTEKPFDTLQARFDAEKGQLVALVVP
ncbi:MAG: hypothetical protein NDI77_07785 [Geobacteraceae bacterium]|nr:hypothetical protein [Geobacteraceae bacterium]